MEKHSRKGKSMYKDPVVSTQGLSRGPICTVDRAVVWADVETGLVSRDQTLSFKL